MEFNEEEEGRLTFKFSQAWRLLRPEKSSFYQRHFQNIAGGSKETDFVLQDTEHTLWLLEVKDYNQPEAGKPVDDLILEVAQKARDCLAFLLAGSIRDNSIKSDSVKNFMQSVSIPKSLRFVLHIELPKSRSKLFPQKGILPNYQHKLRQKVKGIDPHARVVDSSFHLDEWAVTAK